MVARQKQVAVPGSERAPLPNAHAIGPAAPDERLEVTIRVRQRQDIVPLTASMAMTDSAPGQRTYLSREQYEESHGADPKDITKVKNFAKAHHLTVVDANSARRSVVLSGTVAAFNEAFGVELEEYEYPGGTYRGRTGPVHLPATLAPVVEGVFGLDDRPQFKPHFQIENPSIAAGPHVNVSYTPVQLARLYNFPTGLDGSGQCIGIIELGGGYRTADIKAYFAALGIPAPKVKSVLVDHAHNHPTTASGADGEVMLDIEVAAAIAPKAHIVVYFAPNTDQGFLDAITTAIHDNTNKPSVISISWGAPEANWTAQSMQQFNQAFQAAAALGVTVCCASGDNGSGDGLNDGHAHVDFPASSPFALGCGGTKLVAAGNTISSEVVWNENPNSATGGGVSDVFPLPAWQSTAHVPHSTNPGAHVGRGVPDVAGDADPATGYKVRVDGQDFVIGGTSAVAPLWAGLIALMNQQLAHPVGYLNPLLYGSLHGTGVMRDISSGSNGAYHAGAGWDACTGWGVPDGAKLLHALTGQAHHTPEGSHAHHATESSQTNHETELPAPVMQDTGL